MKPELYNTLNYFGLYMLMISIIILIIVVYFYAKWHIYGPKWRRFIANQKAKRNGDKGPKIKKGAVITPQEELEKLNEIENKAQTPQELLEAQNAKEEYEKRVRRLEEELKQKELEKQAKKNKKEEGEL